MMKVEDKQLLRAIPNYWINLIAPAQIEEADFEKFNTNLGIAIKVLKYQNRGVDQLIFDLGVRKVGRATAEFLNVQAKLELAFGEPKGEGEIDMCKAMEIRLGKERAEATENTLLQNIRSLMETVKFTAGQTMNALRGPTADQPRLAGLL